ncbi:MAG: DUF2442 domain-containing protein [Candidatus Devosia phytovorans]|uniref:DUF2442 domain-containing protein n=1 Tax=Candidatus Devosia phytovorans TaxID=3121372 RepID=A0AAJ5VQG7_9HYPH|nr:DUF2442 domain-containing protein [Devosia sp.]WEK02729.1 MAG: DUF2442 domain-containing protein [Devosia sp.]
MSQREITEDEYEAATQRGEIERARSPNPSQVRFDRQTGRVLVDFSNGAALLIPARSLQGLEDASDDELAEVELLGETGLHWESRDVDFTIDGLMRGVFGTAAFMAQRKGGQSRSEAKVAASRANGAQGGRPRKARP